MKNEEPNKEVRCFRIRFTFFFLINGGLTALVVVQLCYNSRGNTSLCLNKII